ncbi:MAG: hypothetical protein WBA41_28665 [Rivularia sp. (in: cyanobacteria)]
MKINTLHFGSFFCTFLLFAFFIIDATDRAFAQSNLSLPNQSVLNGLYSPTSAERFFEEGKRKIEREVEILTNTERYKHKDILQNNAIEIKTIEETGETNPSFNNYNLKTR